MISLEAPVMEERQEEIKERIRNKQKELEEALAQSNIPGEAKEQLLKRIMKEITELQSQI